MKVEIGGWKLGIVSVYGSGSEHSEDVRTEFWESLTDSIKEFGEDERLVILGDLNARVGRRRLME